MKSFTDIGQFRDAIRKIKSNYDYQGHDTNGDPIYLHTQPYPTLRFRGTVKLHGTNSAVVAYKNNNEIRYEFQCRERILSLTYDNSNFMLTMLNKDYKSLFNNIVFSDSCVIYGEWCGKGVQKGMAISELPKMFVIFAIRIDDVYQDMEKFKYLKNEEQNIYNIMQFETYTIDIDINNPELIQNKLIDLTLNVEAECPIGKYFDVIGIGEGIIWEYIDNDKRYVFKVKGEKHQNSKVKTLTTINVEEIQNIKEFVEYAVTENRLAQGIDKMNELKIPLEMKSTGDYLRWIYNDVIKEELDTIVENGIDVKKIGSAISAKARTYWINYLNSNL